MFIFGYKTGFTDPLANIKNNFIKAQYILIGISSICLVLLTIFNIFIGSNIISIGLSILGLVVFSGYVLYDVSLIKYEIMYGNLNTTNDLSIHVLNLYIDFINILLDMLNIASKIND